MEDKEEYVDLRNEPQHVSQLENPYIRLYFVGIEPQKWSLYHKHSEDTFYIFHNSRVKRQKFGEETIESEQRFNGDTLFRSNKTQQLIHRVFNDGTKKTFFIGIEVKQFSQLIENQVEISQIKEFKMHIDNPRATLISLTLKPDQIVENFTLHFKGLIIFHDYGEKIKLINTNNKKADETVEIFKGRYIFYDNKTINKIQNLSLEQPVSFYILILKTNVPVDDNRIIIKNGKQIQEQISMAQQYLKVHQQIILIGVGKCVEHAISVSNILEKNLIGKIVSIKTSKIDDDVGIQIQLNQVQQQDCDLISK